MHPSPTSGSPTPPHPIVANCRRPTHPHPRYCNVVVLLFSACTFLISLFRGAYFSLWPAEKGLAGTSSPPARSLAGLPLQSGAK